MSEAMVVAWGFVNDAQNRSWSYWVHEDGVIALQPEHTELPYPMEFPAMTLNELAERGTEAATEYQRNRQRRAHLTGQDGS